MDEASWAAKSTLDLLRERNSYLDCVNKVGTSTACMIIKAVGKIDEELEKRSVNNLASLKNRCRLIVYTKGRIKTGTLKYARYNAPNFSNIAVVSVVLDESINDPGYSATVYDAKCVYLEQ